MKESKLQVWLIFAVIALAALLTIDHYDNPSGKIGLVVAILIGGVLIRFRKK